MKILKFGNKVLFENYLVEQGITGLKGRGV